MAILDLFSKRQKRLRGEIPDIYTYDVLPNPLKVQIIHMIQDTIGVTKDPYGENQPLMAYNYMHKILCHEYGVFSLGQKNSNEENIFNYFLNERDIEKSIDVVELCFRYIDKKIDENLEKYKNSNKINQTPKEAIDELNDRFKENGIGFQFESGEIIRIDSEIIHTEITKPTLKLLWSPKFSGANEEYLKAHEHYRHGKNKECLSECLKAMESVLKVICKEKGWTYNETDTAKKLIQVCFQNELIPAFLQSQFTSLQSLIESGIPTIRNKLGGHGQGQEPKIVDDDITRYAMNLTGSNIVLLVGQSNIK